MNIIAGTTCPSVVCQLGNAIFAWSEDGDTWAYTDTLPDRILAQLPPSERERCANHLHRRLGDRSAA